MRATSLLTVSAALLFSALALAQQAPPASHGAATAVAPSPRAPAPDPLQQADISKIEGVTVLGGDGQKIGDVATVLMQPQDKRIDRLVVHTGGVLGLGGRYVPMPIAAFSWDGNRGALTIAKTANDVQYMAAWKPGVPAEATASGSSQLAGRATIPPSNAGK